MNDLAARVCALVTDAMAMPPGEIQPDTNLSDLGAESLELIDIVFRIEQEWDLEITRGELERAARGDMTDDEFAPDGVIGEAGLARLRDLIPESADRAVPGLRPGQIHTLFTPLTFARLVQARLDARDRMPD